MQVQPVAAGGEQQPAGSARAAWLLPEVAQLLQFDPKDQARHAERVARRQENVRRREDDVRELAVNPSSTERLAEDVRRAEQAGEPGSRSARMREHQSPSDSGSRPREGAFQRSLSDATGGAQKEAAAGNKLSTGTATREPLVGDAAKRAESEGGAKAGPQQNGGGPRLPMPATALAGAGGQPSGTDDAAVVKAARAAGRLGALSGAGRAANAATVRGGPPSTAQVRGGDGMGTTGAAARLSGPARRPTTAEAGERGRETERTTDANIERVLRLIHTRVGKERSVATLRLDPPELGSIRVRMDLQQEQLSLRIDAETSAARRLLADHVDALRRGLEAAGIQLERVEVRVAEVPHSGVDADLPQHADVHSEQRDGAAREDTQPQGSGAQPGVDSPLGEQAELPATQNTLSGPAAESLVNVWA